MPEDAAETDYYFQMLLGDALQERKQYIEENGHLYMDAIDVE